MEIVSDFDGDTFRGIYTVKFRKGDLRSALLSEEIAKRDQDRKGGHG